MLGKLIDSQTVSELRIEDGKSPGQGQQARRLAERSRRPNSGQIFSQLSIFGCEDGAVFLGEGVRTWRALEKSSC